MSLKASYKYQMRDNSKALILYYIIIALLYICLTVIFGLVKYGDTAQTSGIDSATVIFIFIMGLCSFKEAFGMLLQNGISRKTLFKGRLLTAVSLTFFMAVADKVLMLIFKLLTSGYESLLVQSYFEQLYHKTGFAAELTGALFGFTLYLSAIALGYFISVLFYRLGKAGKVAVGAGVPVVLFVVMPIIDGVVLKGRISMLGYKTMCLLLGLNNSQPFIAILTFFLTAVVLSALSWLLIRRASVK